MQDKKDTPIYSAREDDCEARDEISAFVIHLAEQVDGLQDAESQRDLQPLSQLARALASDAERFGFKVLAEIGLQVAAAGDAQEREVVEDAMTELTNIARRIRLGHRGAA